MSFRTVAAATTMMMPIAMGLPVVAANAVQAPVGEGFTITPSDLSYILKQIKISERHAATYSPEHPCDTLIGTGPDQIPSPLVSAGLRTVDGSCNNLQPGQERFGSADQQFPRLTTPVFKSAEDASVFGGPAASSYAQKSGTVVDSEPRVISNLIVDQTSTNPAAVAAAGNPVRTQGNTGVVPCTQDPDPLATPPVAGVPADCVPSHSTLFIENVTTDVGLSPPYNSMFTLFGQFFDHGVDQTVKSGGTVFVPLKADDPLRTVGPDGKPSTGDEVPASQAFMVLTRGQNQPGPDGILGNDDDIQDANNTDSPWVDQSQTYTSHASHQVFLREYVENADGKPVSTGKLLGGETGTKAANGMATWATTKLQAKTLLGLRLEDKDVLNVPMIAADPYGKFIPGPARGLPQYVTATGLVEGQLDDPTTPEDETVPVPANVKYFDTPFLTDIAHNADPSPQDTDHNPATAKVTPDPDSDETASADFAHQPAGTYDDEMLDAHFIAGDGRVNENIGLTAIHQIFHSEHDRLVDDIENVLTTDTSASGVKALAEWKLAAGADGWNGERLFQAARFITEMEYQHLVFEEFARKVQPAINPFEPFAFTQTELNPAVKAEFAHAVYRFGHSMLTETISRRNEDGAGPNATFGDSDDTKGSQNDISLLDGFLNPPEYTDGGPAGPLTSEEAAGSIIMGMADQAGNELDEFVTDTLRNNLLGLPLDLPTINMTRARSEGIPRLNVLRREIFNKTNDGQLKPYISWVDFGENLKHPESLVNFVAAYGQHPSITGATTLAGKREAARLIVSPAAGDVPPADAAAFMNSTGTTWSNDGVNSKTGLDNVDLWVGGLAETTVVFGGLLGSTFNYVFENQLTDLQNGDRLYYLARTPGMNLRAQLEGNSFAEMMMRNTNVHSLKADVFATSDCKFELKKLGGTPAGFAADGNTVADDPDSECSEPDLLIRMPDGTIKYRARNTVDPSGINGQSVYNGTAGVDRIFGGNDSDTFWGGEGNDVIEGGDGADVALGGDGDDIITDLAGDDVPKGGPGNDAIDAGPGLDIVMGGDGKDFTNGGANANETFAGAGDDFVMLGQSLDAAFGDSGDDWEEGGDQPDLMQGDSGNLFFLDDSQKPGHDILIGQGGDDDYDMEGGDDIGLGGPGIEKVAGASGFDWEIGLGDPQPQNLDLDLPLVPLDILTADVRDKFNEVEAASGWKFDDKIRGDDVVPSGVGGGGFIGCNVLDQAGLNRITGLDALVPDLDTSADTVIAASASKDCPLLTPGSLVWGAGNVLLGGGGSDEIEGRGANDVIDGDAYLSVRLSVRTDPDNAATEIGSAAADGAGQSAMTSRYLRDANGALTGPTLQEAVFAGTVNPGNIVAVREILTGSGGTDSARFSGPAANYTVDTVDANGAPAALGAPGSTTTVTDTTGTDGTDTLRNVERLLFSDSVAPAAPLNVVALGGNGQATVSFTPATTGGVATAFQVRVLSGGVQQGGVIDVPDGATSVVVTGLTNGTAVTFEVIASNAFGPSAPSLASNAVTPAVPRLSVAVPSITGATTVGSLLTANPGTWGPQPVTFAYQWFSAGVAIVGGNGSTYTVKASDAGKAITVQVTGSKDGFVSESRTSAAVTATNPVVAVNALRDFNGDGNVDIVARDNAGVLWTYLGNGSGTFPTRVRAGGGWNIMTIISASGDVNGDGRSDLLARESNGVLWSYLGNGSGTFPTRIRVGGGWNGMNTISASADLNGDGRADLVARDNAGVLWTYRGNGAGTFPTRIRVGGGWNAMTAITASADLNGDGRNDLVARDNSGVLWSYQGNGAGLFPTRVRAGGGWNSMTAISTPGDLNGDGRNDLVARDNSGVLWSYQGNGAGLFPTRTSAGSGWNLLRVIS
ncbi:peroxidase family protein [Arthrobacter sp. AFG20]|uniref:peroxidase family protein n=1 Tax=Arthrobacter sp. AFG20 TaxID=1688671 RepID=UPI0015E14F3A|nr:peroxidase family protein [Arthrobacter sp. AFG20]